MEKQKEEMRNMEKRLHAVVVVLKELRLKVTEVGHLSRSRGGVFRVQGFTRPAVHLPLLAVGK